MKRTFVNKSSNNRVKSDSIYILYYQLGCCISLCLCVCVTLKWLVSLDSAAGRSKARYLTRAHILHFVAALLHALAPLESVNLFPKQLLNVLVPILGQQTNKKSYH